MGIQLEDRPAAFVPVFVAWQGFMAYADRFATDDLAFRAAYFGAMMAIAAMAVLIDDVARGIHSAAFALAAGLAPVLVGLVFAEGMLLGPEQWTAA